MTKYVLGLYVETMSRHLDFHGYWDGKIYHSRKYEQFFPGVIENINDERVKKYSSIKRAEYGRASFDKKRPGFTVVIEELKCDL